MEKNRKNRREEESGLGKIYVDKTYGAMRLYTDGNFGNAKNEINSVHFLCTFTSKPKIIK